MFGFVWFGLCLVWFGFGPQNSIFIDIIYVHMVKYVGYNHVCTH